MRSTDRPGRASRDQRGERLGPLRRRGVDDHQPQVVPVADRLGDAADELARNPPGTPHLRCRMHLAVGHLEDRVHRQQLPRQRLRAADPAAALQVGERVERDEAARLAPVPVDERLDRRVVGARAPAASCTPSTALASDADTDAVSTTVTRPANSAAASRADSIVPDSLPDTCSEYDVLARRAAARS